MSQFGSVKPGAEACAHCEAMLMDVLDRTASAADQAFFDRHIGSCTSCTRMFVDATRGGAWLEMLRDPRPVPAAGLLERILEQTTGAAGLSAAGGTGEEGTGASHVSADLTAASILSFPGEHTARERVLAGSALSSLPALGVGAATYGAAAHPVLGGSRVLPFRVRSAAGTFGQRMLQPRLAMTAAMAFFSIALTLNLTGVHVSELRVSDLRPAAVRRGFHEANAHVVRYYDNLRVVYELEARVHDLERSSDGDAASGSGKPVAGGAEDGSATPAKKAEEPGKGDAPAKGDEPAKPKANANPRGGSGPGESRSEPVKRDTRALARLGMRGTSGFEILLDGEAGRGTETMQSKGDPA